MDPFDITAALSNRKATVFEVLTPAPWGLSSFHGRHPIGFINYN